MIEMCKDVTFLSIHDETHWSIELSTSRTARVVSLCLSLWCYKYTSFPQDGGSLLIAAAQSGNFALFDWMVDRFILSPPTSGARWAISSLTCVLQYVYCVSPHVISMGLCMHIYMCVVHFLFFSDVCILLLEWC